MSVLIIATLVVIEIILVFFILRLFALCDRD